MRYDALVIGGGPAGATVAALLARGGRSVAVIEKAAFPRRKVCGEFISAASLSLLRELGVAQAFAAQAGPEVRRVGLFAGDAMLAADMPRQRTGIDPYGRALGREHLDALLLQCAADAGAHVLQPMAARTVEKTCSGFVCGIEKRNSHGVLHLEARALIAAHGSWERGALPTQPRHRTASPADLFAFKAHFIGAHLERGLMPLLAFPGGYGGMVTTDAGRVSFSCCIRRDRLDDCRRKSRRTSPATAVFEHVRASCRGVREALDPAQLDGCWLATGPVRPGVHCFSHDGIYAVGNAAGEAHPIVAEGISMALQSAWLLGTHLAGQRDDSGATTAARRYALDWHRQFGARVYASALFARLAAQPDASRAALAVMEWLPGLLTLGAWASGKTQRRPAGAFRRI
jgi:menaquinone-9 beta-reductase